MLNEMKVVTTFFLCMSHSLFSMTPAVDTQAHQPVVLVLKKGQDARFQAHHNKQVATFSRAATVAPIVRDDVHVAFPSQENIAVVTYIPNNQFFYGYNPPVDPNNYTMRSFIAACCSGCFC